MKVLDAFYRDTIGGSFGKPRLGYAGDGWYVGECVSYVRQYMEQVQGVITANWGDAKDYWSNATVLSLYDRVSSPRDGDIVVWGDDAGSWTGPAGHIAIWYQGRILNQNYAGIRRVTVNQMFYPGLLGYLRKKEVSNDMIKSREQAKALYVAVQHRNAKNVSDREADGLVGRDVFSVIEQWTQVGKPDGQEWHQANDILGRAYPESKKSLAAVQAENAQLKKQLASGVDTDAQKKLQAIKEIVK